jgi:hypothetical protein
MSRRRLITGASALLALTMLAGCPGGQPGDRTTAELPRDGCTMIADKFRDQLVPFAKIERSDREDLLHYSWQLHCSLSTNFDQANTTANGKLEIQITRNKSGRDSVGRRRFNEDRDSSARGTAEGRPEKLPDVGDDAFQVVRAFDERMKAYSVRIGIVRQFDYITISYTAGPSTAEKAGSAMRALATYLVAVTSGKRPEVPSTAPFDAPQTTVPKATLKPNLPTVAIVGPTWRPRETTFTTALYNVPFAFRSPTSWKCSMQGTGAGTLHTCYTPNPEAKGPGNMSIFVRPCASGCPADVRARMNRDWLTGGAAVPTLTQFDDTTYWTQITAGGRYTIYMTHFFGDDAATADQWQVTIVGWAGAADQPQIDALQKVINDIRSQTP